jgi:hypothetical protein
MSGPLFTHGTGPTDPAFTSRLRDELNALIALRDYYCLAAVRQMQETADPARESGEVARPGLNLFAFIRQLEHGPDDRELSDREFALLDANLVRPDLPNEMERHESRGRVIRGTHCTDAIGKAGRIVAFNRRIRENAAYTGPSSPSAEPPGGSGNGPPSGTASAPEPIDPARHLRECLGRLRLPMERLCDATDVATWNEADCERRAVRRELLGGFRFADEAYRTLRTNALAYLTQHRVIPERAAPIVDRAARLVSDFIAPGGVFWDPPRLWLVNELTAAAREQYRRGEEVANEDDGHLPDRLLRDFREANEQARRESERHRQCVELTIEMARLEGELDFLLAGARETDQPTPAVAKISDTEETQPIPAKQPTAAATPRKLLTGWREIAAALDMKHSDRDKIKSLNARCGGPIKNRGSGTPPMVYRDELIEWWNRLAVQAEENENRRAGARASAEAQHNYGREGTAAPEIGGAVKKRRRPRPT